MNVDGEGGGGQGGAKAVTRTIAKANQAKAIAEPINAIHLRQEQANKAERESEGEGLRQAVNADLACKRLKRSCRSRLSTES